MKPSRATLTAVIVFASLDARAQETSVATARQLAITGIDAIESGDCEKGTPQLERAEQLHHASVHLQYLARCRASAGRLVAATEMWRRIIREGAPTGSSPAVTTALGEAQTELEKTLPRLASTTIRAADKYEGLSLTLDGAPLPADMVGAPQILDPGDHELTVSARGFENWQKRWQLAEGGAAEIVVELTALPEGATAGTPPGEEPTAGKGGPAPWLKPAGWVTASIGAASMIAGTVTLLTRNNRRSELENKCSDPQHCSGYGSQAELDSDKDTIRDLTTASNVLLFGGGALLAGGATLIIIGSQGSGKEPQTALLAGSPRSAAGLTLQGRW
jgi:hypothetical protein